MGSETTSPPMRTAPLSASLNGTPKRDTPITAAPCCHFLRHFGMLQEGDSLQFPGFCTLFPGVSYAMPCLSSSGIVQECTLLHCPCCSRPVGCQPQQDVLLALLIAHAAPSHSGSQMAFFGWLPSTEWMMCYLCHCSPPPVISREPTPFCDRTAVLLVFRGHEDILLRQHESGSATHLSKLAPFSPYLQVNSQYFTTLSIIT